LAPVHCRMTALKAAFIGAEDRKDLEAVCNVV